MVEWTTLTKLSVLLLALLASVGFFRHHEQPSPILSKIELPDTTEASRHDPYKSDAGFNNSGRYKLACTAERHCNASDMAEPATAASKPMCSAENFEAWGDKGTWYKTPEGHFKCVPVNVLAEGLAYLSKPGLLQCPPPTLILCLVRWEPQLCTLRRLNGAQARQCLSGKRIAFVGDSLSR